MIGKPPFDVTPTTVYGCRPVPLSPAELRQVRQIAQETRRRVLASCSYARSRWSFPRKSSGRCRDATTELVRNLHAAGIPATHAHGLFVVEDRDEPPFEHHFALVGCTVVDVTADQFNAWGQMLRHPYPKVYVGPMARHGAAGHAFWKEGEV